MATHLWCLINASSLLCFPEPLPPCTNSFQPILLLSLVLVQNNLLGRSARLACGSMCMQSLPANFLSWQWHLTICLLLKARHVPVRPHLPLLASACCAEVQRTPCPVTDRTPRPVTELRRSPATSMCVNIKSGAHNLATTQPL